MLSGRHRLGRVATLFLVLGLGTSLTGCAAVEGIFKIGAWFGVAVALVLVGMVAGVATLFRK